MKKTILLLITFFLAGIYHIQSQDTFSIVALDSTSREIGSAGASCLDLDFAGISNTAFITDILPDTGVVNTQSYFIQLNQDNARLRMRAGDSPAQIITWLVANDPLNNPEFKQYGIVGFNGNSPSAAAHTGSTCLDYKNHITGSINGFHYSIQGNILKGQEILDSMESKFRNTNGPLACRLMAAMQGANVIGADTRCANDSVSSLFAFLQMAKPTDTYGNPSINISLKTKLGDGIEPIDSLQTMFNTLNVCTPLTIIEKSNNKNLKIYPNPTNGIIQIDYHTKINTEVSLVIQDLFGHVVFESTKYLNSTKIDISELKPGIYIIKLMHSKHTIEHIKLLVN